MRVESRLVAFLLPFAGCTSAGEECVGGLVLDGGECIARCNVAACVEGNRCVNNECKLVCETSLDCIPGSQDCVEVTEDVYADGGGGGTITVCVDVDVDACAEGYRRVNTECKLVCETFLDCIPDSQNCLEATADVDANGGGGEAIKVCVDTDHPPGIGEPCPVGDECDGDLVCLTRGEGDGDAYCAEVGCTEDSGCTPGYRCGVTHDPRRICGTSKGDNDICGRTNEDCLSRDDIAPPYSEGSVCLLRNTCIKPAQCSPCESDLDCLYGTDLACVDIDGEDRCAPRCNSSTDCNSDSTCIDDVCKPKFGSCTGNGGFCEPCLDDRDCGDESSSSFCVEYQEGQFGCTTPCASTFDCYCGAPLDQCYSPGGLLSQCLFAGYCAGITPAMVINCWEP